MASSSAGNSAFVATERTRVLVDAGLSRREIAKRLASIGEDIDSLDAVLITHEHSDHTSGLAALAKGPRASAKKQGPCRKVPVYLTHGTAEYVDWGEAEPVVERFQAGCCLRIGEFDVSSFTIPHDAADPVGYTLTAHGIKIAIATDLGYVPDSLEVHLRAPTCYCWNRITILKCCASALIPGR